MATFELYGLEIGHLAAVFGTFNFSFRTNCQCAHCAGVQVEKTTSPGCTVWFGCVQETFAILRISSSATLINLLVTRQGEKSACNATEAVRKRDYTVRGQSNVWRLPKY
jgi:hypothetical protein